MQVVAFGDWHLANGQQAPTLRQPPPGGSSAGPGPRPALRHVIPHTEEPQHVMVGGDREQAGQRLIVQKEKVRPPARGRGRGETRLVQGHDPMRLELQALAPTARCLLAHSPQQLSSGPGSDRGAPSTQRDIRDTNWHAGPEMAPLTGICVI